MHLAHLCVPLKSLTAHLGYKERIFLQWVLSKCETSSLRSLDVIFTGGTPLLTGLQFSQSGPIDVDLLLERDTATLIMEASFACSENEQREFRELYSASRLSEMVIVPSMPSLHKLRIGYKSFVNTGVWSRHQWRAVVETVLLQCASVTNLELLQNVPQQVRSRQSCSVTD
jgi:hypothetical protein